MTVCQCALVGFAGEKTWVRLGRSEHEDYLVIRLLSGSDWDGNTVVYCGREKLPAELAPSSLFGFLDGFRLLSSLVFSKFRDMNRFLHFDGLVIEMLEESFPKF